MESGVEKYNTLLSFLNELLVSMNKDPIADILDFKGILRADLISNTSKEILSKNEDYLLTVFDKTACDWYNRRIRKHYILCFIRYACKITGYKFAYRIKNVGVENGYRSMTTFYSILPTST